MAKLRPATPEHMISAELQQEVAESPRSWEADGLGYGKPRALTGNSSALPPEEASLSGDVFAADPSSSLHTEPDMDTIMPLRRGANGQLVNVVSPAASDEVGREK